MGNSGSTDGGTTYASSNTLVTLGPQTPGYFDTSGRLVCNFSTIGYNCVFQSDDGAVDVDFFGGHDGGQSSEP